MAVQQHSTRTPARPLLPATKAFAPGGLLPVRHSGSDRTRSDIHTRLDRCHMPTVRVTVARQADLLAILDAGPLPQAYMTRQQRRAMQAGIDALIDNLDAVEPDPDLENGGDDEPTMGARETGCGAQAPDCLPCIDEAEQDADEELSLGAPEVEFHIMTRRIDRRGHVDQRRWADGSSDHDDGEPSDGSAECSNYDWHWPGQAAWADGYQRHPWFHECEKVSEDEGACIQSHPHDAEPSEVMLGAPDNIIDQRHWCRSGDTLFPDESEPSLASPENPHDQRHWTQGAGSVELDHDEQAGLLDARWQAREPLKQLRRETEALLRRKGWRARYLHRTTPDRPPC